METLESRVHRLALKYYFLNFDSFAIQQIYSDSFNYRLFLKDISILLKEDKEFFLMYPKALGIILDVVSKQRFKEENRLAWFFANEVIVLTNQLNHYPNKNNVVRNYYKRQFYLRFGTHEVYQRNEIYYKENAISSGTCFLLELQSHDYEVYCLSQSEDFSYCLPSHGEVEFISSINYLSQYLPEMFTDGVVQSAMDTLEQIAKDESYKQYYKATRKNLKNFYKVKK